LGEGERWRTFLVREKVDKAEKWKEWGRCCQRRKAQVRRGWVFRPGASNVLIRLWQKPRPTSSPPTLSTHTNPQKTHFPSYLCFSLLVPTNPRFLMFHPCCLSSSSGSLETEKYLAGLALASQSDFLWALVQNGSVN